ncbi:MULTISPECIES: hypothetical protein [Streptomyces]|uniref:Hydrolase n=1 Tax=Streptomyces zinciresistens K42 TaxID=700597 RepID=G2G5Z5_9ACTN|nr:MULTISPECIES: hypothetical protein [Streptomyces]EGX61084.1 hydrolase [Streptomyces zinciresistens K42]MDT9696607.1 hypothetical protein [Streptomyces sp. P17]
MLRETGLGDGVLSERRVFHVLSTTEDQTGGPRGFVEKRTPRFSGSPADA